MSAAQRNRCEVAASALDEAGCGVGPESAVIAPGTRTVHVTDLLPGERAEVVIDHASPHKPAAWGHIVRRLGATSPDRVAPACPAFGRCGGCVWQHLAYPAQLAAKRQRVVDALAGVPHVPEVAAVRPAPAVVGYRNKGKYVAGRSGEHLVLGAYAPRSHHVIDTLGCRVVAPIIDELATWVRGAAEAAGLAAYDETTRSGELRYVIVREVDGDVLIALVVAPRTRRPQLDQVAAAVAKHPAVRGVVAIENDRRDGAIIPAGSRSHVLVGTGVLVEDLAGVPVEVGAGEFLQVNRAQATALYARVAQLAAARPAEVAGAEVAASSATSSPLAGVRAVDPVTGAEVAASSATSSPLAGVRAVDLFAGVGGIGMHLARAGAEVVAVEIDREAVALLERAAQRAGVALTAIAADAGGVDRALLGRPDVVVVNPPRKGLSEAARALLVELAAPTVIYVSCGPEALGRDLTALAAAGWTADAIEPFDLMPGTAQVETVVRLRAVADAGS